MATIKDVAAVAGVSFTTVSHVVNNSRPVSADVRAKVERAIRDLNYVPSAVARSLKARATATVGLLVPNGTNPYFAELARGVEDACARKGYCVFFCNSDDDPAKQRSYLRVLQEKRIDGLIVASAGDDAVLASTLADTREPIVVIDRNMRFISDLCDRVLVMAQGRELARGLPHEVLRNEAVIEAYLGRHYAKQARH